MALSDGPIDPPEDDNDHSQDCDMCSTCCNCRCDEKPW